MKWRASTRPTFLVMLLAAFVVSTEQRLNAYDPQNDFQETRIEKGLPSPRHQGLEERMKEFQQQMEEGTKGFEKEFQSQEKQEWLRRFDKQAQEFQKKLEDRAKELEKRLQSQEWQEQLRRFQERTSEFQKQMEECAK